jgi:hypothetical protein
VVVKRAAPAGPRARIAIGIDPAMVAPGDQYVPRYWLQNETATPMPIATVSVQNVVGEGMVTGGAVEPLVRTIPPNTRGLIVETRDVWRYDLGTPWKTTLRVLLTDGSVYSASLEARR